jgi:DNA (cytosine-5)-methyltransferase 1
MLRHVDLCSGIGGFALGFEWAGLSRPVMFCDIEPWPRKILAKHWPDVPIEEDVKVLANEPERIPECSILTAGYPCQPFSHAGKRRGEEDDRHIWPYIREIVAQKRPTWCVFENVYGHLSMGIDTVLSNLEADGYSTRPFIVPACGVDAAHRRDRIWIIARNVDDTKGDRNSGRLSNLSGADEEKSKPKKQHQNEAKQSYNASEYTEILANARRELRSEGSDIELAAQKNIRTQRAISDQSSSEGCRGSKDVADTDGIRSQGVGAERHDARQAGLCRGEARGEKGFWSTEPPVGRVANGIPNRVDRLKGLGNAIVPQIAMQIGLTIKAVNDAI